MKKNDRNTKIQELKEALLKFREERNWKQFHVEYSMSISVSRNQKQQIYKAIFLEF